MSKVTILNSHDIGTLLDIPAVIQVVKDAYAEKATKDGEIWPMVYNAFSETADTDIRSGFLKSKGIFGNKELTWFGNNSKKGLPELHGAVTLYSSETGAPEAFINAPALTGFRTGAAGAVATKALANPNTETLLMVGAGGQAAYQIMAQICVLPELKQVLIYDPMSSENAGKFVQELPQKLTTLFADNVQTNQPTLAAKIKEQIKHIKFIAASNIIEATKNSQVIVTATPSTKPLIKAKWIQPGTHINAIGADMEGKQELDTQLYQNARAFADDLDQASEVGETQNPIKENVIKKDDVTEIGNVIAKKVAGRQDPKEITIFDSTGIALQDLEAANLALQRAKQFNVGVVVDL
ncbi:MAG: ornithine cyclodeaminase family protein [Limosilactobacillus sp.]|jgi:ornithine cyclodeaminase/alanine dehydrogenase|uniref:ornithine cyclodeaminase family protein n=1 Tax=Limosilactobacillus sp. TaxID=2773925 RepID=UPI0025B7E44A|nr:ornithine cyclodeaminase family protein [Limosilactobacillus sp.]MCI1974370.1 ornithine cyclodeaminase family protein [Limosilactobacillus sp.]MCI2030557.1 ornithine cyclodeaminase family protein [Limosilactobacillus sp.]